MSSKNEDLRRQVQGLASFTEIVKAEVVGDTEIPPQQSIGAGEEFERMFAELGALTPPYDPEILCSLFENSDALRPNVDAYVANIDSHGHRFEPVIDFSAEDAREKVAMAIRMERLWLRMHNQLEPGIGAEPSDDEVGRLLTELQSAAEIERLRLETWADICCLSSSFVEARRKMRMDLEVLGNAYFEVLRNMDDDPFLVYVPGFTMRLLPQSKEPILIDMPVRVGGIFFHTVRCPQRFRRFVQIIDDREAVYFKELGDPRVISRTTGEVFETLEELKRADPKDEPATEIFHFNVHSPRSGYGVPRWIGAFLEVLGNRKASEVNFLYFDNKSIPPMALLVSGGRVSEDSVSKIEDFVENHLRGRNNFHKILIIEAESSRGTNDPEHSGRMRLEFVPLTGSQQQDSLFRAYSSENRDILGAQFRLPRITRGDIRDFNRATAISALQFAEGQVFQPLREEFDFAMNRRIFGPMGIRFHRFVSRSPITRDPDVMSQIIERLVKANVLTPQEGRRLAGDVFNQEFRELQAAWVKQPLALTLAGFPAPDVQAKQDFTTADLAVDGGALQPAQGHPTETDFVRTPPGANSSNPTEDEATERLRQLRRRVLEREVVKIPAELMASWFEDKKA